MRLKDKVAVVTGAAQGIGKSIADRFTEEGASVTLCDVNAEKLETVAAEITKQGGTCQVCSGDIVDRDFVKAMVDRTVENFGGLNIMINNASITRDEILHNMTEEQWDQVMNVNLKGTFNCLQAAAVYMRSR